MHLLLACNKKVLDMKSFIELENIGKTFQAGKARFEALKNINLEIEEGSHVAITGKSGSGKSTLLNLITGIDRPSTGNIAVSDFRIDRLSEKALTKWRGSTIGIVFQFFQLLPTISVLDNLLLPMDFIHRIPKRERKKRAITLLEMTGMEKHAHKFPNELSGGEQQRVAISRALANDPDLVVADEPTGNLDTANSAIIKNIFKKLHQQGKTIILVTHETISENEYDQVVRLSDGKILAS